jgi:hypothetical protein
VLYTPFEAMMQASFPRVVASDSQEVRDHYHHSRSKNEGYHHGKNDKNDDGSPHPKSVNLLHDQNEDDDDNSQDSEETELPSQSNNVTFGLSRNMQRGESVGTISAQTCLLPRVKPTAALNKVRRLSTSSISSSSPSSTGEQCRALTSKLAMVKALASSKNNTELKSQRAQSLPNISKTVSGVPPLQSPTTEALMELSQHMDELQYPKHVPNTDPIKKNISSRKKRNDLLNNDKNRTISNEVTLKSPPLPQSKLLVTKQRERNTKQDQILSVNAHAGQISKVQYDLPPDFSKDWTIVAIRFPKTEKASLGISILRNTFPGLNLQPSKRHCVISRIIQQVQEASPTKRMATYCTSKYGLRKGDWFLAPGKDYSRQLLAPPILADFDQISQWSKQKPYRMVCVLRKTERAAQNLASTSDSTKPVTMSEEEASNPPSKDTKKRKNPSKSSKGFKKRKTPSNTTPPETEAPKKKPSEAPQINNSPGKVILKRLLVPFCNRCTAESNKKKRKPRLHHVWCPHNPFFDDSGAKDFLLRIVRGRNLGCQACENEFQTGKPILKNTVPRDGAGGGGLLYHNSACLKNQKHVYREQEERKHQPETPFRQSREKKLNGSTKRNQNRSQLSARKTTKSVELDDAGARRAMKSSKGKSSTEKCCKRASIETESLSSSSSERDDSIDDSDDASIYRPKQKNDKIETLRLRKTKKQQQWRSKAIAVKASTQNRTADLRDTQNSDSLRESSQYLEHSRPTESDAITNFIDRDWVALEDDPWGPEGHVIGDVVLYSPARGQGHYETFLSSNRYKLDPFEPGSVYRNTHFLPEEGFNLILIKRDTLGKTPWGFHVGRDEFGHACLVTSVELSSPASAATWVGASSVNSLSTCVLNVNDMLVMINGKPVGGMSEVGLSLELQLSSPDLYLAVSRYKLAPKVRRTMVCLERQALVAVDSASRDVRLIGWQEIGNGAANEIHLSESNKNDTRPEQNDETITMEETTSRSGDANQSRSVDMSHEGKDTSLDFSPPSLPKTKSEFATSSEIKETMIKSPAAQENRLSPPRDQRKSDDSFRDTYDGYCDKSPTMTADVGFEGSEQNLDNDPNPWLGCVCGEIHSLKMCRGVKMFWIQCESCNAWYDVAEQCIGFTEKDAESKVWKCEACEPYESEEEDSWTEIDKEKDTSANDIVKDETAVKGSRTQAPSITENQHSEQSRSTISEHLHVARSLIESDIEDPKSAKTAEEKDLGKKRGHWAPIKQTPKRKKCDYDKEFYERHQEASRRPKKNASTESAPEPSSNRQAIIRKTSEINSEPTNHIFGIGELVMLQKHSWPGVDNEEGVGRIVDIKVDEDGDKVYDVKYMCGGSTAREVHEEYIKPYSLFTKDSAKTCHTRKSQEKIQ